MLQGSVEFYSVFAHQEYSIRIFYYMWDHYSLVTIFLKYKMHVRTFINNQKIVLITL